METIFHSENILFVKVCEDLVNDYLDMVNDIEGVAQYIGKRRTPYTFEEELKFIRGKLEEDAPIFSMIESKSGEFIGNIEFMAIKDDCGELGIAITAKKQDMHYGTEAIKRMLEYGFLELGLKRIFLKVYPNNERAIHVYEKCGFVKYDANDEDIFMEVVSKKEGI